MQQVQQKILKKMQYTAIDLKSFWENKHPRP